MTALPIEVVETDHNLETVAEKSSEQLAKHRWHWTADESNDGRVNFSAYARAVGRSPELIRRYAIAYVEMSNSNAPVGTISAIMDRVGRSEEQRISIDAVASANETGADYARKVLAPDVSRVRDALDAAVERQPDMTADDKATHAAKVAARIANEREHEKTRRTEHKASKSSNYILVVGDIERARRSLLSAVDNAVGIEWGESDEAADLTDRADAVVALGGLLRSALAGASGVDWDVEMTKLGAL